MTCMNTEVLKHGRCDYCDARCPYYASEKALMQARDILGHIPYFNVKVYEELAHNLTIRDIEEDEQ